MPYPIITAIAAETSTIAVNHPQTIDFSVIDTLVGAIIAMAAMIVVGFVLFKYGVIKLGESSQVVTICKEGDSANRTKELLEDRQLRRADRAEIRDEIVEAMNSLKELISELRDDMRDYLKVQQECQRMLPEKYVQWEIFNRILTELKEDRLRHWDKFDTHGHDEHSGVVIFKKVS
jgi:hypothetical protein